MHCVMLLPLLVLAALAVLLGVFPVGLTEFLSGIIEPLL
jgi:hypothetical protein